MQKNAKRTPDLDPPTRVLVKLAFHANEGRLLRQSNTVSCIKTHISGKLIGQQIRGQNRERIHGDAINTPAGAGTNPRLLCSTAKAGLVSGKTHHLATPSSSVCRGGGYLSGRDTRIVIANTTGGRWFSVRPDHIHRRGSVPHEMLSVEGGRIFFLINPRQRVTI